MFNLKNTFEEAKVNKGLIQSLLLSQKVRKNWKDIVGPMLYKEVEFCYINYDFCNIFEL